MPLIAGLGNPGNKYEGTRHNIGFALVEKLAKKLNVTLGSAKGPFLLAKGNYGGHRLTLIKPTTYMNNSGEAIQQALHWFKLPPEQCLVCYDDLNLDAGILRMRRNGSAGGHNGIKDIINKVGSRDFPRLRIGIGNNFRDGRQVPYVLSPFSKDQRPLIDTALEQAVDAVLHFVCHDIETAMNTYN